MFLDTATLEEILRILPREIGGWNTPAVGVVAEMALIAPVRESLGGDWIGIKRHGQQSIAGRTADVRVFVAEAPGMAEDIMI